VTLNEKMIRKYIVEYKEGYFKKHNEQPKSWFSFLKWLASFTMAGSFNNAEIKLVKSLLA
jgi:hypothetical protein